MSTLSTFIKFLRQAVALLLLPWLAWSCQMVTGDYDDEIEASSTPNYINVTISVTASNNPVTRAPQGGEYGDDTEQGVERENKIKDITLIFYQDNAGINITSNDAEVVCVERFAVRPFGENDLPDNHTHKTGEPTTAQGQEVLYTTGNQRIDNTQLTIGQTYKVLVVANADMAITAGSKIKDVREQVLNSVFTGTGIGVDAKNFVMASETDATVTLTNPTPDTSDGQNKMIYYFDCIHIERLAARIDYNTIGSEYSAEYSGYKYDNGSGGSGFFVVTKVTPFNLYNEDEFYFKRVRNNWTDAIAITYLGDETTVNYVIDPNTVNKASNTFSYLNPLASLTPALEGDYTRVMSAVHEDPSSLTTIQSKDNVIIGYAKENTLCPNALLKNHATGLAFEVKWYDNENSEPKTFVYYHYLRHQGEKETGSYQAKKLEEMAKDNEIYNPSSTSPAMNYGIVRNNIYRVSIEGMSPDKVTLHIKVKKWDKFVHEPIYM